MIQLKDVSKIYDNGTVGLKGINLTINKGEFVVVVGLSGAGKSTLLRSINHLHDITSGDILIDGKSITSAKGKNLRKLRRDIGMIFQNFNLVKRSSVLRNVLVGRVAYYPTWKTTFNLFSKEDKQKAYEALQQVDLADKVYARADELSGGQQQRVAIARAIVNRPKVLIADEPTGNLDPETSKEIINVLMRINEEQGTTVLVVTHDQKIVQEHKKRTILMEDGCINADTSLGGYDL